MNKRDKIFVAGHRGLVGSAIVRCFRSAGLENLLTRSREQVDLMNQRAVEELFAVEEPRYVILAAARVGGILANSSYPGEFIRENLLIQTNVIHEAYRHGVERLLFLGSSCIYPRDCPQPIREEYLMTGWKRQIRRMRSRKLPAWRCATIITGNTGSDIFAPCLRTCMARVITLTRKLPMFYPP